MSDRKGSGESKTQHLEVRNIFGPFTLLQSFTQKMLEVCHRLFMLFSNNFHENV